MMRRWANSVIFGVCFIIVAVVVFFQMDKDTYSLSLAGHDYQATIMRTEAARERGLSGTASLPSTDAAFFIFPKDAEWAIWMKDMRYSIDIVWLDKEKTVVQTVKNATPESYPNTVFRPGKNARYVIELASGTIERTGIKIGDIATLPTGNK